MLATIPVGTSPNDVAVDPAPHRAFVICEGTNSVSVIDERSLQQTMRIDLGAKPAALAVDAATHRLFVALPALSQLAVIDTQTGRTIGVAPGLPQVADIGIDEQAGLVYIAGASEDRYGVGPPEIVVVAAKALRIMVTHLLGYPGSTLDSFAINPGAARAFVAWAHLSTPRSSGYTIREAGRRSAAPVRPRASSAGTRWGRTAWPWIRSRIPRS